MAELISGLNPVDRSVTPIAVNSNGELLVVDGNGGGSGGGSEPIEVTGTVTAGDTNNIVLDTRFVRTEAYLLLTPTGTDLTITVSGGNATNFGNLNLDELPEVVPAGTSKLFWIESPVFPNLILTPEGTVPAFEYYLWYK